MIELYLKTNNINYKNQKSFNDCIFKRKLYFDFYLEDYNLCIEYDGRQHFVSVEIFGGDKAFIDTKIRDEIKTKYCLDNNINLLRINHKSYKNINDILFKYIKIKQL